MPRQGGRGRRRKFADDGWTDSEDESTTQDEDTEGPSPSKRVKGAVTKAPSTGTAHFNKKLLRNSQFQPCDVLLLPNFWRQPSRGALPPFVTLSFC